MAIEVGLPHHEDAWGQLTTDSVTMNTTRKEEKRKTQRNMEENDGKRTQSGRYILENGMMAKDRER